MTLTKLYLKLPLSNMQEGIAVEGVYVGDSCPPTPENPRLMMAHAATITSYSKPGLRRIVLAALAIIQDS